MNWTPLQMKILLHYYGCADDFRNGDFSAPAVREAIDSFRGELGLLEDKPTARGLAAYRITERGRVLVEEALRTPLPKQSWVIPRCDVVPLPVINIPEESDLMRSLSRRAAGGGE